MRSTPFADRNTTRHRRDRSFIKGSDTCCCRARKSDRRQTQKSRTPLAGQWPPEHRYLLVSSSSSCGIMPTPRCAKLLRRLARAIVRSGPRALRKFAAMIERNWTASSLIRAPPCRGRDDERPYADVWISDRYSAQQKHGAAHQTCLPHLARDTAFALEHARTICPCGSSWVRQSFDLARDIASFKASTIASKRRELEKQLATLLAAATGCDLARNCRPRSAERKSSFSSFATIPARSKPPTMARAKAATLRDPTKSNQRLPRYVGRAAEADARTTVDTARLTGANHFQTILDTLV